VNLFWSMFDESEIVVKDVRGLDKSIGKCEINQYGKAKGLIS
jgi:hypothetical protein